MSGRERGRTAAPSSVPAENDHFLVSLGPKEVYLYNVTITPRVISCKPKRREIMSLLGKSHPLTSHLAYGGNQSAFSARALPFVSEEFIVKLTEQEQFKVTIKFDTSYNSDRRRRQILAGKHDCPQETIRALNVVLRDCPSYKKSCIIVDPSLFDPGYGNDALGDGVEYWKGLYERLQISVNINVCARAFSEPMFVSDFVAEFLGKDISMPLSAQQRVTVDRALSGVKIVPRHGENFMRPRKVQGLTAQPFNKLTFVDKTGAAITVIQHFHDKYGLKLQFPLLPAIKGGTEARPTYLPMEICKLVPGQRYALKLNEKQMSTFLEATCQHPRKSIRNLMYDGPEVYPLLGHMWNMINLALSIIGPLPIFQGIGKKQLDIFVKVVQMCVTKGMVFNPEPLIRVHSAPPHNVEKALVDILFECNTQLTRVAPTNQLQMLFVILPEEKEEKNRTYLTVKLVCKAELGFVYQCCKPQHVIKPRWEYLENVALKINVMVGGRNTVLSEADVTHPSIAARL